MADPTEDVPYTSVDEFATEDSAPEPDADDQSTDTRLIKALRIYLRDEIAKCNTFDVINLPANASPEEKIAAFDEMAIHKGLAMHLRNIQQDINNIAKDN